MSHHRSHKESSRPKEPKFVPREPEEGEIQTKRSGTLLSKVRSLFSWVAGLATQEAREGVGSSEHVSQGKRCLSVHLSGHLLQRAERAVQHLDRAKAELLVQMGQPAHAFIERYIEPILSPAREIIAAARTGGVADVSKWAVAGVEMLSLVQEDRLRRKIYEYSLEKTRDAILEDMAFIVSYPNELLGSSWIPLEERPDLFRRIETSLQPILHELEGLLTRHPRSLDLKILFQWKKDLDEERQRLHDLSLTTIDNVIKETTPFWPTTQGESTEEEFSFMNEIDAFAREPSWPLSIFELEETSMRLRKVLEEGMADRSNERIVEFFERMKGRIDILIESDDGDIHEAGLLRLKEHIRVIERLLGFKESA